MTCLRSAAAAASVLGWSTICAAPLVAQAPNPINPQIEIAYVQPTNPSHVPIYERLRSRKVLEELQQFLAPLKLPRPLLVKVDQCGSIGIRYKPQGAVTICYEYVEQIRNLAPKSTVKLVQGSVTTESAIVGPFVQAVLHEISIAAFDLLEVPIWGRQDDAADRVAAFIMLQFGPDVAWNTIVGTAWFLSGSTSTPPDYADVRGVVAQRYYTTLCIAFGSDQRQRFARFVGSGASGNLPAGRANGCHEEYDALRQGFEATIMPHIDQELLKHVRSVNWLKLMTEGN